jgi:hypothetical protein
MRVVLRDWTSNPDYRSGCDYALVEIGEEIARLALRRIKIVLGKQKTLNETYYWDSPAQLFSPWATFTALLNRLPPSSSCCGSS